MRGSKKKYSILKRGEKLAAVISSCVTVPYEWEVKKKKSSIVADYEDADAFKIGSLPYHWCTVVCEQWCPARTCTPSHSDPTDTCVNIE